MPYAIVSPLRGQYIEGTQLPGGFRIERNVLTEHRLDPLHFSLLALRDAQQRDFCLRVDFEGAAHDAEQQMQKSYNQVRAIALALQVHTLIGWDGITVGCPVQYGELNIQHAIPYHAQTYFPPKWTDYLGVHARFSSGIRQLIEGTVRCLQHESVRVRHPFEFLEAGLQTGERYEHGKKFRQIPTLLWTFGLDGLLSAESTDLFSRRLCRLLGGDTFVFPADHGDRQPAFRIEDIASDLYTWRGFLTHGKEVAQKFWQPSQVVKDNSLTIAAIEGWQYQEVLREAAAFMLCRALRKVVEEDLVAAVADKKRWEQFLDGTLDRAALKQLIH